MPMDSFSAVKSELAMPQMRTTTSQAAKVASYILIISVRHGIRYICTTRNTSNAEHTNTTFASAGAPEGWGQKSTKPGQVALYSWRPGGFRAHFFDPKPLSPPCFGKKKGKKN